MVTRDDLEEKKKHRAIFHIHEQDIRHMLQVPEDVTIWGIRWNEMRMLFEVMVVSDRFDEVYEGCEAPYVGSKRTWKTKENRMVVEFGDYHGNDVTIVED